MSDEPVSERLAKYEVRMDNLSQAMKELSRDLRDKRTDMDGFRHSLGVSLKSLETGVNAELRSINEKFVDVEKKQAVTQVIGFVVMGLLVAAIGAGWFNNPLRQEINVTPARPHTIQPSERP